MTKTRVIIVEPGKAPVVSWEDLTLEWMQKTVGGYIEAIYPFDDPVALICNDEGKLNGSKPNRALWYNGKILDVIYGTFIVTGAGSEDLVGLSRAMVMKYVQHFRDPEFFVEANGKLIILKESPGSQAGL